MSTGSLGNLGSFANAAMGMGSVVKAATGSTTEAKKTAVATATDPALDTEQDEEVLTDTKKTKVSDDAAQAVALKSYYKA